MDEPAAPATDARSEKAQEEAGGGGGGGGGGGRLKRAAEHVETFCAQTSIHGLKYIGERRRPWPERLVWALAFALSLGASAVLIGRAWRRWQDSPVIVAMDERLSAVWEVPFPAITICPETRVRTDLFNYTDAHLRWRWGNLSRAEFQGSGAYLSYGAGPEAEAEAGAAEWSPDDGYAAGAGFEARPRRALGAGALLGLTVIQLHSPAEFPRMSQQYFRAQLEQDVVVAVAPQVMRTSPELRSYLPHQRQCFLAGERRLRFFRVYSQQNCALECLANATRRACGCAPFYMPREVNETICGTASWKCVQDARDRLLRREAEQGLRGDIVGEGEGEGDCDCLQSCSALAYTSERSQAHFDWARMLYATGEDVDHSHG
ncbi:Pickpocket protein 11 [Gryllus bimaculatus]|nr:Pickpocket protein 11 [Gryllus bimaculatus]